MPYPFVRAPTAGALISRLETRFGIRVREVGPVTGPRGEVSFRYLEREMSSGGRLHSEPLPDRDEERIGWDLLRRICNQLHITAEELDLKGLHLGFPNDPQDTYH